VVTSVGYLLWIVLFAMLCCLPLEIAKYKSRHARTYFTLTSLEVILSLDLLRAYAWAWWAYVLGVARIVPMDDMSGSAASLTKTGAWPWVSALATLAALCVLVRDAREAPAGTAIVLEAARRAP
jgi:hypothetical protein